MKSFKEFIREDDRPDWMKTSNKTSIRRKVGGKFPLPVVHKAAERLYDSGIVSPKEPAHDLGSGKYNSERDYHRSKGRKYTGSDVGANVSDDHEQGELDKKNHHKLITIPNVVNTVPGNVRRGIFKQAAGMLHKDGHVLVNHPKAPRKHNDSDADVENDLKSHFGHVEKAPESKSGAPVWHCKEPKK